ncbi:MAG: hypothetical protein ABW148_01880 [Sedimenticola sp.]
MERKKIRHMGTVLALITVTMLLGMGNAFALVLDDNKRITVKLKDGTDVSLIGAVRSSGGKIDYYYLPPKAGVALNNKKRPEFVMMKFITDKNAENGGVSGGLIHFLMTWGLSTKQTRELETALKKVDSKGRLKGAVPMRPASGDHPTFDIISATLKDDTMTQSLIGSGSAPLQPNGKAAAAARLTANGAQLLFATLDSDTAVGDISVAFNMGYDTQLPAAKGRVVIDWSKIQKNSEKIDVEYTATTTRGKNGWCYYVWGGCRGKKTVTYTYEEIHNQFSYLMENKYIDFDFEENYTDERVNRIREAFINYFISSMSQPTTEAPAPRTANEDEDEGIPDIKKGNSYTYNIEKINTLMAQKRQVFRMDYKLSVRWPFQIVGNIKDWYDDVKGDPSAVQEVILSDKFFDWRDIMFLVDADTQKIFEEQVNFVTVNVRKPRSAGMFEDSVTIDKEFLATKGLRAAITYARGSDRSSDLYQYKTQWSLRGGDTWPKHASWKKGDWEGVTLAAPLKARTIELEGDLEELADSGFTRVSAQVRYSRLGKEQKETISLSVAKGEPLTQKTIFTDRNATGYAYRLVLNHKRFGKLALPWDSRINDDYIYAVIPPPLLSAEEGNDAPVTEAKDAAKTDSDNVLAKFDGLTVKE